MAISKPKTIKYDLRVEGRGDAPSFDIKFRGLNHGEQRTLLMSLELKDEKAIINAILDIIKDCTFGTIDVKKTPMYVLDYVFLKIYIATVGVESPVLFTCGGTKTKEHEDGTVTDEPCGLKLNTNIRLDNAALEYPEDFKSTKLIEVDSDISLKMKIPDFEAFKKFDVGMTWAEAAERFVWAGLEAIIDHDEVKIPSVDFTLEELKEFLDSVDPDVMAEIGKFFDSIPDLVLRHEIKCPNCGRKELFVLKGLDAFLR